MKTMMMNVAVSPNNPKNNSNVILLGYQQDEE